MNQRNNWLQKRKSLWWWVPDVTKLDDKSILEGVMNYGRWQDFLDLKKSWGLKKINELYQGMIEPPRCNLRPQTRILYGKYLVKHAI